MLRCLEFFTMVSFFFVVCACAVWMKGSDLQAIYLRLRTALNCSHSPVSVDTYLVVCPRGFAGLVHSSVESCNHLIKWDAKQPPCSYRVSSWKAVTLPLGSKLSRNSSGLIIFEYRACDVPFAAGSTEGRTKQKLPICTRIVDSKRHIFPQRSNTCFNGDWF